MNSATVSLIPSKAPGFFPCISNDWDDQTELVRIALLCSTFYTAWNAAHEFKKVEDGHLERGKIPRNGECHAGEGDRLVYDVTPFGAQAVDYELLCYSYSTSPNLP